MQSQKYTTRSMLVTGIIIFGSATNLCAGDIDGDGVDDTFDECCNTPVGVAVDAHGRPIGDFDLDCDNDLNDYSLYQQGFTGAMDPGADRACNPIAQTGCNVCEKCALVRDAQDPGQWRAYCRPDGSVPHDGACAADAVTGLDDCMAGLTCAGGVCAEICSAAPNSCPTGENCNAIPNVFNLSDIGFCKPPCDPLATPIDCPNGYACYLSLFQETTACNLIAGNGTQGVACQFINTCEVGYSCVLNNDPLTPTGLDCAFICDASTSGGPTCVDGPGAAFLCVPINRFYANVPNIPDAYGMCVDPIEWDEDGDSVLNFEDLCPGTPPATPVGADGCPI